ncbi:MAG: oligosaccharide flippase family protein, partial [Phormidesmis sp.]
YLTLPTYSVQMALITRENRMKIPAIAATLQMILFSVLALCLATLGFGLWSIILPHVLVIPPVYFLMARKNHSWRPRQSFTTYRWREIFDFSKNVLGSHFLDKIRSNLDYLLVGGFLGVEALGLYYFAYNAGIGISLNLMDKLSSAQFPYICAARTDLKQFRERYFKTMRVVALVIIPFVGLQTSMAHFYVPIVFGEKWIPAVPILMLVCLSAIPRAFGYSASMLLQAVGRADLDFRWNVIFTTGFAIVLVVVVKQGLIAVAASVLVAHVVALLIFCIWAIRFSFKDFRPEMSQPLG